jgi:histidyl-tRNA synthetase
MKPKSSAITKFVPVEHLDKIGEIAVYYGFSPIKSPAIIKTDLDAAKDISEGDFVDDETERHGKVPLGVEEKIALMRTYEENDWASKSQPVQLYLKDPCRGASANSKKHGCHRYADLEILGASGPIAEATLIQAGRAMLKTEGHDNVHVEINSIGDKDSMARFSRELISYYRKNINDMTPECRQLLKKDAFELLASHEASCQELNKHAPRSMDFLSETSRRHLEEVLEYLETLKIPYVINNSLIGNRSYCTETIFALVDGVSQTDKSKQRVYGIGVRYNGLAKRLGMKKDIQGIGLSLLIKNGTNDLRDTLKKIKRPIASFVQLGSESKLMSLDVIERLRHAKIPLYLSLAKDRLGAQVSSIERFHTPYVIVMGKKEAVEKSVIVRKNDTYSQDVVSLEKLAEYMKKVEKDYWGK